MGKAFRHFFDNLCDELEDNPLPYDETREKLSEIISDRHELDNMASEYAQKCNLCGNILESKLDRNNAEPLKSEGDCCSKCSDEKVIPARLEESGL